MHKLAASIAVVRAPLAVLIFYTLFIGIPDQSREVLDAVFSWPPISIEFAKALIFLAVFHLALFASAFMLAVQAKLRKGAGIHYGMLQSMAAALLFYPAGCMLATVAVVKLKTSAWINEYSTIVILASCAGLFVLLTALFFSCRRARRPFNKLGYALTRGLRRVGLRCAVVGLVLLIALPVAVIACAAVPFGNWVGPTVTILSFFIILCFAGALLTYIYDRHQLPVISSVIGIAVVSSLVSCNDNHQVRPIAEDKRAAADAVPLDHINRQFAAWLGHRRDLEKFANRPYPVYIVAAEGGGLYAAAHAAFRLAQIQDHCAAFNEHLFAISSVSGGSVGGALFAATSDALSPQPPTSASVGCGQGSEPSGDAYRKMVRSFFHHDFLSPLLAATLFPDFLQRFLPVAIGPFDRARALERSFEDAWANAAREADKKTHKHTFRKSVRFLWRADGAVPALMLNSTVVQSGDRVIAAPFNLTDKLATRDPFVDLEVDALNGDTVVALSTAVGISARFPYITPPASVTSPTRQMQLVDGGYFENSALITAINIIQSVTAPRRAAPRNEPVADGCAPNNLATIATSRGDVSVCFKIIIIKANPITPQFTTSGEVLAPFFSLYRSRIARGVTSQAFASSLYCGGLYCGRGTHAINPHIYISFLKTEDFSLGWYMSQSSLDKFNNIFGSNMSCEKAADVHPFVSYIAEENRCLLVRVSKDLS